MVCLNLNLKNIVLNYTPFWILESPIVYKRKDDSEISPHLTLDYYATDKDWSEDIIELIKLIF